MDFTPSLKAKNFYRFTGPPEHWLTAIKFMTWGLENDLQARWKKIQPGDVFFIHSTKNSEFPNARSGIIGIGVVGSHFTTKENRLWLLEQIHNENRWPLLVPISEFYLFSKVPSSESWENPSVKNAEVTKNLIDQLLKNAISLSTIKGFPQMGSFSAVSDQVADQILNDNRPLYSIENPEISHFLTEKQTNLENISDAAESLRYTETLKVFDSVRKRIIGKDFSHFVRDNELLTRAENAHVSVLQQLINIFKKKGYETRSNKHVDLFAFNEEKSFLCEVKSIENRNFKPQAQKGIIQLLEYDYFEVQSFIRANKLKFQEQHNILVTSREAKDTNYIEFINFLRIGVGTVSNESIHPTGADFGFSKI